MKSILMTTRANFPARCFGAFASADGITTASPYLYSSSAAASRTSTAVPLASSSRKPFSFFLPTPPPCATARRSLSDDSWSRKPDGDGKKRQVAPEEGSQHSGVVRNIQEYGCFVRIDGMSRDGLVHVKELADDYVSHPNDVVSVGDRVQVVVLPYSDDDTRINLSMRRVKPVLPESFQPCTAAVFGLHMEMGEEEVKDNLNPYGKVVGVTLMNMPRSDFEEHIRQVSFITFETRDQALNCIKKLKRVKFKIGSQEYVYKVNAKMSKKQTFKQELQAQLDQEHEEKEFQLQMMEGGVGYWTAKRVLDDLIPHR